MPARPWYAWNPGDYRRKTAHLNLEQDAAYRRLLDFAWDHDGIIPGEIRMMANIWGVHTNKAKNLWGVLRSFWYETGGGFRNNRLDRELAKAIEISKERSEAGRAGGLAKAKQLLKQKPSKSQPQPQKTLDRSNGATRFGDWWETYPKKRGKRDSLKIWKTRHLDDKADTLIADTTRRRKEDRRWLDGYAPDPATYLRGARWEDEIQPAAQSQEIDNPYWKPIPGVDT